MNAGVYDVIRGCHFQERRLDLIANNLANAATTGFKKDILFYDEMLQASQKTNMAQGSIKHTGNPLDLALSGEGFFKVSTPDGVRYTRNGRFYVNAEGVLASVDGAPVMGESGSISIEGNDVMVDPTGRVMVDGEEVDKLSIVSFEQRERLQKQGFSYYVYNGDESEGRPPEHTAVNQGYLEQSNVAVTEEIIKMVETIRRFESYQKVLQVFDETDSKVINEVGKL